jgi:Holliday junction resolvase
VSASKRKGSTFERAVVEYLADHGFPQAERRVSNGTKDRGDVAGVAGWILA